LFSHKAKIFFISTKEGAKGKEQRAKGRKRPNAERRIGRRDAPRYRLSPFALRSLLFACGILNPGSRIEDRERT
jgi:hypothetical protein